MMKISMTLIFTLLLLISTGYVAGEEIAKEGTDSGDAILSGTWKVFRLVEGTAFVPWESKGIMLRDSDESPFQGAGGRGPENR